MLSYSLVLALFLLGPGFATYAGLFFSLRRNQFQSAPPQPNSIFSLAVVGMAALAWHTGWALVLTLNDGLCRRITCLAVPFEPDVYVAALASGARSAPVVSGAEVAALLSTCLGLSGAAFVVGGALGRVKGVVRLLRQPLYGLYAGLAEEAAEAASASPSAYVTAYVLTDMQKDGAFLGYFGILENLQIGADKQVAGVAIVDVGAFLLKLDQTVHRTPNLRDAPIERMLISGDRIQNIAFEVIELV